MICFIFTQRVCKHLLPLSYQTVVADQRIALSAMLGQLLDERDKRRVELKKRLVRLRARMGLLGLMKY